MNKYKLLADLLEEYHYNLDTLEVSTVFLEIYAKEYAKLKCQELLLLVADKAETKELFVNGSNGGWYEKVGEVDKDSIINAVDLEKFCS